MRKISQVQSEALIGKEVADFNDADVARVNEFEKSLPDGMADGDVDAMVASASAGITNAKDISDPQLPIPGMIQLDVQILQGRVVALEALVKHMLDKFFPNVKATEIIDAHIKGQEPSKIIDPHAHARG